MRPPHEALWYPEQFPVDPLNVLPEYGTLPIAPPCADAYRPRRLSHRGVPTMTWNEGLLVGLTLGIPLGTSLAILLGGLDRWLDVHWKR